MPKRKPKFTNKSFKTKCRNCLTSEGCEKHRRFTCPQCDRTVSWTDGASDDAPDWCSDCWLAKHEAMGSGSPLPKSVEAMSSALDHILSLHSQHSQRREGERCTCGGSWPCPYKARFENAKAYRLGHVEHDHVTRQVKPLGAGCKACDATHDIAAVEAGMDVEEMPLPSPKRPKQHEANAFEATHSGVLLVHGEDVTMVVPASMIDRLVTACVAALSRERKTC